MLFIIWISKKKKGKREKRTQQLVKYTHIYYKICKEAHMTKWLILYEIDLVCQVQTLEEAVYISLQANSFGERKNNFFKP